MTRTLTLAATMLLLAGCSDAPAGTASAPTNEATAGDAQGADSDPVDESGIVPPEDADDILAAFAGGVVIARISFDGGESAINSAARAIRVRANQLSPHAATEVDDGDVVVTLPGVSDADAADGLTADSVIEVGLADASHSEQSPHSDFDGCGEILDDGARWACTDDGAAFLVTPEMDLGRPSAVSTNDTVVTFEMDETTADGFRQLSADAACRRDQGELAALVLLAGTRVITAPSMNPTVVCGEGITGGEAAINATSAAEAEELADVLRSSLGDAQFSSRDVRALDFSGSWPRSGQLDSPTFLFEVEMDLSGGPDPAATGTTELTEGAFESPTISAELLVPRIVFDALGLADCEQGLEGTCIVGRTEIVPVSTEPGASTDFEVSFDSDTSQYPWPAAISSVLVTGPEATSVALVPDQ